MILNNIEIWMKICTAVKLPKEMREASHKIGMAADKNISTTL